MNNLNIEIDAGTSALVEIQYLDDVTGLPKDLSNSTVSLLASPYYGAPLAECIELSTDNQRIDVDLDSATLSIYFPPDATEGRDWNQGEFDIIVTELTTSVRTKIARGLLTIVSTPSYD